RRDHLVRSAGLIELADGHRRDIDEHRSARMRDTMRRSSLLVMIPIVGIAALIAPMVLTGRTFGIDWSGHLWLVEMQARNITALGRPSLFIQSGIGAFYPWYAFYGGTLYSIAGGLSVLSGGHSTAAYIACYALAFA